MGFFSRSKGKDGATKVKSKKGALQNLADEAPPKPQWDDAWTRTSVDPEEVQELVRGCTLELKSKGMSLRLMHEGHDRPSPHYTRLTRIAALDMPFLLLPFRPTSDPSAARTFVRHFFDPNNRLHGDVLAQELRLTEPMVSFK